MDIPFISRIIPALGPGPEPEGGFARAGAVLVTGASTGIGEAIARDLAGRGVRVFAGVRKLGDTPSDEGLPGSIEGVLLDVTKSAQVSAAVGTVSSAVGPEGLRGLVNNAGIAGGGPMEFMDMAEFSQVMEVNVTGAARATQAFIPLLRAHGDGRLVFTSSMAGHVAPPYMAAYAASKHAVAGFADSMRRELGVFGISVAVLSPGGVATPIWDKAQAQAEKAEAALTDEARTLYPRAMKIVRGMIADGPKGIAPQVVADACRHALYAGSARADYILGQDARVATTLSAMVPAKVMDKAIAKMMG